MSGLREVRGRVAVVTGASSGIGEGLARELNMRGAKVALVARRENRLKALADELSGNGALALPFVCDLLDPLSIRSAHEQIESQLGPVELLINNAGYGRHILFVDHDAADIEQMMRTNYMGTVHWLKCVLPSMRERGEGWLVNVGSFAGKIGQADEAAYSASKFAVAGLSQGLSQELASLGIHVLCVHPTLVKTEMFTPDVMARMPSSAGSFISTQEFASLALRALAKGKTEAVLPGKMNLPVLLHALFPQWMGRMIGRVKLAALEKG